MRLREVWVSAASYTGLSVLRPQPESLHDAPFVVAACLPSASPRLEPRAAVRPGRSMGEWLPPYLGTRGLVQCGSTWHRAGAVRPWTLEPQSPVVSGFQETGVSSVYARLDTGSRERQCHGTGTVLCSKPIPFLQ